MAREICRIWRWRCLSSTGVQDLDSRERKAAQQGKPPRKDEKHPQPPQRTISRKLMVFERCIAFIVPSTSAVLARLKSSYAPPFNPFFHHLERSCAETKNYFVSHGKTESFDTCLTSLPRLEFGTTKQL